MKKQKNPINTEATIYAIVKYGRGDNCRLTISNSQSHIKPQRYNAGGSGYCKTSTVIAQFINANLADKLQTLDKANYYALGEYDGKKYAKEGTGENSIFALLKALGYEVRTIYSNRSGDDKHFMFEPIALV